MIKKFSLLLTSTMLCSVASFAMISRRYSRPSENISIALRVLGQQKLGWSILFSNSARTSSFLGEEEQEEEDSTVNISFETASNTRTVAAQKGEILRTAMLRRGASPHNGKSRLINCRGLGTCGTCAVEINCNGSDGAIEPKERNTRENLRLHFPPHGSDDQSPHLRLACHVQVKGDITVRKRTGFWGQDSEGLAEEYEPQLWFGELEYILDDKSPSK